ncbi:MAG TPA: VIT domain-containing protein, partial [Desulfomicrobiaceae bacterium]|nr:VIT domain-containing protein [Desulfomicrobiaceae bacterium]
MYASQAAPVMTTAQEEPVCLRAVSVRAKVHDLLSQTRVTQVYENSESGPIETVYTFPLPVDGVLTGVEVKIGDRELLGRAVEKRAAEKEYEERLGQGDSPVMLERLESGLYTLNVGNLLPGERAEITVEFVEVLRVARGEVRYELPTTLGVWYGSPEAMGFEPHQVPEHSLFADNRFSFEMDITGLLAGTGVSSSSHQVQVAAKEDGVRVSLSRDLARMDRDFVLTMEAGSISPHFAVSAPMEEGYVVLAGFTPEHIEAREAVGRSVKIVVDCSGSMAGISMAQAREGVLRILDRLEPQDRFNLILFGSKSRQLFPGQVPAGGEYLDTAVQTARTMDADMGGTEMAAALTRAVSSAGSGELERDILLLTDGDIYDRKKVFRAVAGTGHRVFPIGVGSAPSHALLIGLAQKSGGASMCVAPDEEMGRKMLDHFKRMRFSPVRGATLEFSEGRPESMLPSTMPGIYSGDTVLAWARFQHRPEGTCSLVLPLEDGERRLEARIQDAREWAELLPRLEAQARIESGLLTEPEAVELAVRHNLVSEYTNYLAVVER